MKNGRIIQLFGIVAILASASNLRAQDLANVPNLPTQSLGALTPVNAQGLPGLAPFSSVDVSGPASSEITNTSILPQQVTPADLVVISAPVAQPNPARVTSVIAPLKNPAMTPSIRASVAAQSASKAAKFTANIAKTVSGIHQAYASGNWSTVATLLNSLMGENSRPQDILQGKALNEGQPDGSRSGSTANATNGGPGGGGFGNGSGNGGNDNGGNDHPNYSEFATQLKARGNHAARTVALARTQHNVELIEMNEPGFLRRIEFTILEPIADSVMANQISLSVDLVSGKASGSRTLHNTAGGLEPKSYFKLSDEEAAKRVQTEIAGWQDFWDQEAVLQRSEGPSAAETPPGDALNDFLARYGATLRAVPGILSVEVTLNKFQTPVIKIVFDGSVYPIDVRGYDAARNALIKAVPQLQGVPFAVERVLTASETTKLRFQEALSAGIEEMIGGLVDGWNTPHIEVPSWPFEVARYRDEYQPIASAQTRENQRLAFEKLSDVTEAARLYRDVVSKATGRSVPIPAADDPAFRQFYGWLRGEAEAPSHYYSYGALVTLRWGVGDAETAHGYLPDSAKSVADGLAFNIGARVTTGGPLTELLFPNKKVSVASSANQPVGALPPNVIRKWEGEIHGYLKSKGVEVTEIRVYADTPSGLMSGPDVASIRLPKTASVLEVGRVYWFVKNAGNSLSWNPEVWEIGIEGQGFVTRNAIPRPGLPLNGDEAVKVLEKIPGETITTYSSPGGVAPFSGALLMSQSSKEDVQRYVSGQPIRWVLFQREPRSGALSPQDYYAVWTGPVAFER